MSARRLRARCQCWSPFPGCPHGWHWSAPTCLLCMLRRSSRTPSGVSARLGGLSRALRVRGLCGWCLLFFFSFWSLSFMLGAFRTPLALLGCLLSKRHGGAHQLLSLLGGVCLPLGFPAGQTQPCGPPLPTVVHLLLRALEAARWGGGCWILLSRIDVVPPFPAAEPRLPGSGASRLGGSPSLPPPVVAG